MASPKPYARPAPGSQWQCDQRATGTLRQPAAGDAALQGQLECSLHLRLGSGEAYWQASLSHAGKRRVDMRQAETALLGYSGQLQLAGSLRWLAQGQLGLIDVFLKNATNAERAQMKCFAQCTALTCGHEPYTVIAQPRTLGVRFSKEF